MDFTKAGTLRLLVDLVSRSIVDPFLSFCVADWLQSQEDVLREVASAFGHAPVIVRSSAYKEDTPGLSYAGYFKSEHVEFADHQPEVVLAVQHVIDSYSRDNRLSHPDDKFIVQRKLTKASSSGVVLTRDWPAMAPYYVIDYDADTGRTDTVTHGRFTKQLRVVRWKSRTEVPERWESLLGAVRELEDILGSDSLQIEFGLDESGTVHIFQVRPLTSTELRICTDSQVRDEIERTKLSLTMSSHEDGEPGTCRLLADMSDWNPAEMLGSRCNPLDYSLYRFLITASTWNRARVGMGYSDVRPSELMKQVADKPYIDVETSLRSLTPAMLPSEVRESLVSYGVSKLSLNQHLQDKLEFDLAFSCLDFAFDRRSEELLATGFSGRAIRDLRSRLLSFTNSLLEGADHLLASHTLSLRNLERLRRRFIRDKVSADIPHAHLVSALHQLLIGCRELGVLPFAQAARLSFICISLLRTSQEGAASSEFSVDDFLSSLETIASRVSRDLQAVQKEHLSRANFLRRYGHLRPNTYNIIMPRLDQDDDFFDGIASVPPSKEEKSSRKLPSSYVECLCIKLRQRGYSISGERLLHMAGSALRAREFAKFIFTRALSDAIELIVTIGGRIGFSRSDLAFLDIDTIIQQVDSKSDGKTYNLWLSKIDHNKRTKGVYSSLALPPLIRHPHDLENFEHYQAQPNFVTRTRVEGYIHLLLPETHYKAAALTNKIVLVENADPGYDWLFACGIKGLITKYGGVASHMAIRCGEFGLPAAIGCGDLLFSAVQKGTRVCIDGEAKAVFVL